jgi:hypothetical protein
MKKLIFLLAVCIGAFINNAQAQDVATLLKEGLQLERQQKEIESLEKYKKNGTCTNNADSIRGM